MASNQRIDDLIAQQAFEQVERLTTQLGGLQSQLVAGIKQAKLFSDTLAGAKGLREINTNAANASKELEKLARLQAQTAKAQQDLAKAAAQREAAEIRLVKTQERQAAATERQTQAAQKASQAYQVLNSAYQEATQLARNAGAQFGENSKQFQNAARSANFLRERLDAIDRPLGNYQRNVGNYASGFNGLQNSINQLTREFPAFTYSVQTGFLALSNNIPIFFDQIKQTRTEITRLRAAGEQVPGLFSQLASSVFSWGTALSLGVTFLTIYGKEVGSFVGALFKGKAGMDEFTERQKILNEALKSTDYKNAIQNIFELRSEIKLAKDGFISKEDVVNHYNETIGKTTGLVDNLDQAERGLNANAENYIKYTFLKAAANLALQDAAEAAYQAELDRLENEKKLQRLAQSPQYNNANSDAAGAILGTAAAMRDKNIREEGKKQVKTFTDIANDFLKQAAQFQFNFFDNNKKVVTEATKTVNTAVEDELRALEYQYEQQIALARELDKNELELEKEYQQQIKNYQKQAYDERIGQFEDYGQQTLELIQDDAQAQLIALEESYAKGEIGKAAYEKARLDIEYQANRDSLEAQLSTISQIIALHESLGMDVSDSKKKLSDLTRKLAKADADYEIAQIKSVAEARKALNSAVKEFATQAFNLGVTLVNASYENEKNRIQEQSDAIDVKRDKDIKEVDRQLLSEQEKADKIAVINAKAQAQKDLLDQRRRQVAERQARFDKAVSLANIVQNTYAGAARALKDYPFPFSSIIAGLVIATGLAQSAQVIATPIPKYAKGTDYHKGGPMIVGDAGEELVIEPNGRKYITPDTDTLTMAPKGTKVIPNHELVKMMATPDRVQYVGGQAVDISKLVQAQNKTTAAIQKQQMATTLITKQGWNNRQMKVTNWNAYKQNRLN